MRVTTNSLINNLIMNINRNLERVHVNQRKMASGKELFRPSDDPIAVTKSLLLRKNVADISQYKANAEESLGWLSNTESSLASIIENLNQAREMTLRAANDTSSASDRATFGHEVKLLIDELSQISNVTYAGRYVYSGASTKTSPFDASFDYVGTETALVREVNKGVNLTVNLTGTNVFRVDSSAAYDSSTNSVFGMLSQLQQVLYQESQGLGRPDSGNISNFLNDIDKAIDNTLALISEIGTKVKSIEELTQKHEDFLLSSVSLLSKIEDADMTRVVTDLYAAESVYNASLGAGARIIQPSLLDFLR